MMNGPHGAVQSASSRTRLITAVDGTHADPCSTSMPVCVMHCNTIKPYRRAVTGRTSGTFPQLKS
eukprot:3729830-Prymnesium_polylepis.1